jgi:hypothetical protein
VAEATRQTVSVIRTPLVGHERSRLVVAVAPRLGGLLRRRPARRHRLLLVGGYGDIALRNFGRLVVAVALAGLASAFPARAALTTKRPGAPKGAGAVAPRA